MRPSADRAVTMAAAFAGDGFYRVGASAIQVFGGVGFTWEHDIHLFYKRLLTLQQYGGPPHAHLEELATIVLDSGHRIHGPVRWPMVPGSSSD